MGTSHFNEISSLIAGARATVAHVDERQRRSVQSRGARAPRGAGSGGSSVPPEDLLRASELVARQLRRALDLSAIAIFLLHGKAVRGKPLAISFPILAFNEPMRAWPEMLEKSLPGVASACPEVGKVIAKHQYGSGPENSWLPILKRLSDAAGSRPIRDQEELERLVCGAPVVPTLQRMVTRSALLVREVRQVAVPFGMRP